MPKRWLPALVVALLGGCAGLIEPEPEPEPVVPSVQAEAAAAQHKAELLAASGGRNRKACQDFVTSFNALTCVPETVRLDAGQLCVDALDLTTCDQTAWWTCRQQNTRCEGDRLSVPTASDCPGPC